MQDEIFVLLLQCVCLCVHVYINHNTTVFTILISLWLLKTSQYLTGLQVAIVQLCSITGLEARKYHPLVSLYSCKWPQ